MKDHKQGFNRMVQSCSIAIMIIITQAAYAMASAYRYWFLFLIDVLVVLFIPEIALISLPRIEFLIFCFT